MFFVLIKYYAICISQILIVYFLWIIWLIQTLNVIEKSFMSHNVNISDQFTLKLLDEILKNINGISINVLEKAQWSHGYRRGRDSSTSP